jgi:hypothetical protein
MRNRPRFGKFMQSAALIAALGIPSIASAQDRARQIYDTAFDAYVFGYPTLVSDITCKVRTAVPTYDKESERAPFNQPAMFRTLLDASFTDVKRANVDTLYASACLDVSKEPMVVSDPDMGDHMFMLPFLDITTDVFAVPGTRTTGNKAASYAIVGPGWPGTLPEDVVRIDAPTSIVAMLGRINISDRNQIAEVNALQDNISIVPLSHFGKQYAQPTDVKADLAVDARTLPPDQVTRG